jgi:hypothetical protein
MRKLGLSLFFLLAWAGLAAAQQGSLVQQSGSMLNAATNGASSATAAATQETLTIAAPAGLYVYITSLYLSACNDGTSSTNTNVNWTTTGLGTGAANSPQWGVSFTGINVCQNIYLTFAAPLKSATPGTSVTVVSPGAATNTLFQSTATYYLAP